MDRHDIVRETKRTGQENGGQPLGAKRFQDETGIKESDWFGKYWRNWGDALLGAGFRPNQMQTAYDETALINALVDLIRELGRFPAKADLLLKRRRDVSFPSHNIFSYWHERFADKRMNGEWFALSAQDVRAFKKWRRIS